MFLESYVGQMLERKSGRAGAQQENFETLVESWQQFAQQPLAFSAGDMAGNQHAQRCARCLRVFVAWR